jgi:NTP pyrophosphatase (non-canonical NTP hydrolase)
MQNWTLNEYQQRALETAKYPKEHRVIYPTLGLTGEAGEVSDKVKKILRDGEGKFTAEKRLEIAKEIGDVLWYVATLSDDLGYTLEEIAEMNYEKLSSRAQRGKIGGSGDNR